MQIGLTVGNWLLPLLYLAVVVDYGCTFFLRSRTSGACRWAPAVVLTHVAWIVARGMTGNYLPLPNNYDILSATALAAATVYWILEWIGRDRRAGVFVFAVVFLFQYTASVLGVKSVGVAADSETAGSVWLRLHVVPATVAYTSFTFGAIYGALHLLAQHDLRKRRFGLLFDRLPPLASLGKTTWHAVAVGFLSITTGIISGGVALRLATDGHGIDDGNFAKLLAKMIIGTAAWCIYGAAIFGRLVLKWPQSKISVITLLGFLVTMALLASSIILR